MNESPDQLHVAPELEYAARYAANWREQPRPLDPGDHLVDLRRKFCLPLPVDGRDGLEVIRDLINAAEQGLVGNTNPGFFAWVMGGSHPTGVAADWLTSIWGQNAAIFQCSPAAAVAEEAASVWLLQMLGLPSESSIGFTTGATMACFVALASARGETLRQAGYDIERGGLAGAPKTAVYICEDAHATNFAALRYLGFGEDQLRRIPADEQGAMNADKLGRALSEQCAAKIVLCTAGHINSGAFDRFHRIADLCQQSGAWMHVDGAFGLWAKASNQLQHLADGVERADSWSVDGHKWLQVPYDSGFSIVRNSSAHRRAMALSAGYLNSGPEDGRNPTEFNPELSRRARGFAVWSMLQRLGQRGIARVIEEHCWAARHLAERLQALPGVSVLNKVVLNQVVLSFGRAQGLQRAAANAEKVVSQLNASGRYFLRTAVWRGETVVRISIIEDGTDASFVDALYEDISKVWP